MQPALPAGFFLLLRREVINQFSLAHFSHYQYNLYCIIENLEHVISQNLSLQKYMDKTGDFTMLERNDARISNIPLGLGISIFA